MIHGDRRAVLERARGGRLMMIRPLSMDIWETKFDRSADRGAAVGIFALLATSCRALQSDFHIHPLNRTCTYSSVASNNSGYE